MRKSFLRINTGDLVEFDGVPHLAVSPVTRFGPFAGMFKAAAIAMVKGGEPPIVGLNARDVVRLGIPPSLKPGDKVEVKKILGEPVSIEASVIGVLAGGAIIEVHSDGVRGHVAWPNFRKVYPRKPGLGKFKSGEVFFANSGRLFEVFKVHEGFLCGAYSDGSLVRIYRCSFPHLRRADAVQTMAFVRAKKHYDDERAEKAAVARREYNERLIRETERKRAEVARAVKDSAAKAVNSMRDEEFAQQLRALGHGDGADWAVKGSVMAAEFFSETLKNSDHKVPVELLKQVLDGLKAFEGHRHDGNTENALCEVTRIAHRLASLVDLNGAIVDHFGGDLCLSVVYGAPLHVVSVTE